MRRGDRVADREARCVGSDEVVGVGCAARGRPGDRPAVQAGLEKGANARFGGDHDVVDEHADALRRPVAGVGDGDLDLLPAYAERSTSTAASRPSCRSRRSRRRWCRSPCTRCRRPRLVVSEVRVRRDPTRQAAPGRSLSSCARWRPASSSRHRRGARLDEQVVPLRLGVVGRPEGQRRTACRHGDLAGEPLVRDVGDLRYTYWVPVCGSNGPPACRTAPRPGSRTAGTGRAAGRRWWRGNDDLGRCFLRRRDRRGPEARERVSDAQRRRTRRRRRRDRRWLRGRTRPGSTAARRWWCRRRRTSSGAGSAAGPTRRRRIAGDLAHRVVQLRHRVLLTGGVAREKHLAPSFVPRAELEQLVECQPVGVAAGAASGAGDQVVSGVPDDGVVVAEHSEGVRGGPPTASMS